MVTTEELRLNFGPQHPSAHGVLHLVIDLDGEVLMGITPHIGYLHRGIEKIAEARTYAQIIPLTDRLDYVSSMNNNSAYVMAVEKLAGIPVPERAEFIRVIMTELNRIASHLVWLGTAGADTGAATMALYCFRERERVVELFEAVCGARMTYNFTRIGGVAKDLPEGFAELAKPFLEDFKAKVDDYEHLLLDNYIFRKRTVGIGVLPKKEAVSYGASGPVLRASGVKYDIRKNDPYSVYDRFKFDIPTGKNGDSWDRVKVRVDELRQSVRIVEQALEQIPEGPIQTAGIPRLLAPEPGEVYAHVESPRGELGFYIVSDGSPKPYRLKIRSPAFTNLSTLPRLAMGNMIADLVAILGSLDPVFGEIDR